ncbi:RHS repeat-associated core domain-containing protein [Pseudomonas asiatica]|uniref:RHS repeat-associated core domain-containing protein n=1 Tax=Pseudomonas asiatica TaxID=2219225 RepID=A0ABU5KRL4_9PSED|nr:RHS repeat-associated core domain-containing protein [Pseudomonas asiatica]MDZ5736579.1 RHS repeat-associated core domain-containing protein [Pseudomonas asiatica]MDZ5742038.1 RHS repeat-associated core domain-containing protein [Pseudomonas asiatica]MDZ5746831.1 RHS repeat-associated core domain-containing protein [Pseudomonas asiatica]MDZ5752264.1 RHS repeat-associated core domain-containing protein [Pseudomonas asiatica]
MFNSYSPYGYFFSVSAFVGALNFNGEHFDALSDLYFLGLGYRVFSPALMRFNGPDELSPFDSGGLNCYCYCLGDPVNRQDPNGKTSFATPALTAIAARRFKSLLFAKIKGPVEWRPLRNWKKESIVPEVRYAREKISSGKESVTHVVNQKGLSVLDLSEKKHKFILRQDENFFISTFSEFDDAPLSHASLAELGRRQLRSASPVVAAEYIYRENGQTYVDNHSGHYLPSYRSSQAAVNYLRSINVPAMSVRMVGQMMRR